MREFFEQQGLARLAADSFQGANKPSIHSKTLALFRDLLNSALELASWLSWQVGCLIALNLALRAAFGTHASTGS